MIRLSPIAVVGKLVSGVRFQVSGFKNQTAKK